MTHTHLIVEADVRYWEDAYVNSEPDNDGTLIPFRDGDTWKPIIRLADGVIENWPEGTAAAIYYKVCDQGFYWLGTTDQKALKWKGHYVPNDYLCHGDAGYGDYIILDVNEKGQIEQYQEPDFDPDDWEAV